jgi:hypothetical protein
LLGPRVAQAVRIVVQALENQHELGSQGVLQPHI